MNSPAPLVLNDAEIRERAYHLWLEHGRPDGRDHEFWLKAEALLRAGHRQAPDEARATLRSPRITRPRDKRPDVARAGAAQRKRAHHPPSTQAPPG